MPGLEIAILSIKPLNNKLTTVFLDAIAVAKKCSRCSHGFQCGHNLM